MKHYTFKTYTPNNNINNKSNNYSKILDDIILSDVIKQNNYLKTKKKNDNLITSLFNNKKKNDIKIIIKDTYNIIDVINKYYNNDIIFEKGIKYNYAGIPVIFYDDEIQIGFDTYSYNDLRNINFINSLTPKDKENITKIFININI